MENGTCINTMVNISTSLYVLNKHTSFTGEKEREKEKVYVYAICVRGCVRACVCVCACRCRHIYAHCARIQNSCCSLFTRSACRDCIDSDDMFWFISYSC